MPSALPASSSVTAGSHGNVVRWLLNLASHPDVSAWLLDDTLRFTSWFAALRPHVDLPEALTSALPERTTGVSARLTAQEVEDLRKSEHMPVRGRVSPAYLMALWEGLHLASLAQRQPQVWQNALADWVRQFATRPDQPDQPLSDYAQALAAAPSLVEAPVARVGRAPLVLFHANLILFCSALKSPIETLDLQVLELSFALAEDDGLRMFFELLAENRRAYNSTMAAMMAVGLDEWEAAVAPSGTLASLHLVPFDPASRRVLPLPGFWHAWFGAAHRSSQAALETFLVPLKRERNAGALARLADTDTAMVRRILSEANGKAGTNVLLYGASSIDKLGWVHEQATACGRRPYTLPAALPSEVRASVCYLAQRLLAQTDPGAWLVLPQADTILTRTQRGRHQFLFMEVEFNDEVTDGAGEAQLLVDNPVPTVWLTHSPDRLSENNVGRFLYTCELKAASRAERRVEIGSALEGLGLTEGFITELSQHVRVGEQQLGSAVALVERFHGFPLDPSPAAVTERETLVRQAIEQSQKALNRRQKEDLRQPDTHYSLDLLNLHGAFSVDQILGALRRNPNASLCFYGLPGTGKTQLAEHLAVVLDKPLLVKRASDLLDKYVGESEKSIRAMFQQAQDEDAVLVLDEADSFLRDRSRAQHSWEVSRVNELLQGMERHRGVFVCTTNLFTDLDVASLRRFTFKLEFLPLNETQRWTMFLNETGLKEGDLEPERIESMKLDLLGIADLAPGDFATLQRQCRVLGSTLSPELWLVGLKAEAKAKMREASQSLGRML